MQYKLYQHVSITNKKKDNESQTGVTHIACEGEFIARRELLSGCDWLENSSTCNINEHMLISKKTEIVRDSHW